MIRYHFFKVFLKLYNTYLTDSGMGSIRKLGEDSHFNFLLKLTVSYWRQVGRSSSQNCGENEKGWNNILIGDQSESVLRLVWDWSEFVAVRWQSSCRQTSDRSIARSFSAQRRANSWEHRNLLKMSLNNFGKLDRIKSIWKKITCKHLRIRNQHVDVWFSAKRIVPKICLQNTSPETQSRIYDIIQAIRMQVFPIKCSDVWVRVEIHHKKISAKMAAILNPEIKS